MLLLLIVIKTEKECVHTHTHSLKGGGNYTQFFNSSEMHFLETCFFFSDFLLKLILGGQFLSFFLAFVLLLRLSLHSTEGRTAAARTGESWEVHLLLLLVVWKSSCSLSGSSILLLEQLLESTLNLLVLEVVQARDDIPTSGQVPGRGHDGGG